MLLRRLLCAVLLVFPLSWSGTTLAQAGEAPDGGRELALGREAHAQGRYQEAAGHLAQAVQALSGGGEREALAEAYLRLGMTQLIGLGAPVQALPAFLSSAELAGEPATAYLWAALAAEKLGQADVARRLEARALAAVTPVAASVAAPAAAPVAAAVIPPEKVEAAPAPAPQPDAFQYFFGGKKETPREEAKPAEAQKETGEEGKAEGPEEEKVDAFQYFFGKKKPKPAGEEKPPAS